MENIFRGDRIIEGAGSSFCGRNFINSPRTANLLIERGRRRPGGRKRNSNGRTDGRTRATARDSLIKTCVVLSVDQEGEEGDSYSPVSVQLLLFICLLFRNSLRFTSLGLLPPPAPPAPSNPEEEMGREHE